MSPPPIGETFSVSACLMFVALNIRFGGLFMTSGKLGLNGTGFICTSLRMKPFSPPIDKRLAFARQLFVEIGHAFGSLQAASLPSYKLPLAANLEAIGEGIKYWFKEMEEGATDEVENPTVLAGQPIPICYLIGLRFLARDSGSPFCSDPNPVFNNLDVDVGTALEEAQNLSKPRIVYTIEKASTM